MIKAVLKEDFNLARVRYDKFFNKKITKIHHKLEYEGLCNKTIK
jgi:hypothetical protein